MLSLENKKMLQLRLRIARQHAAKACHQRTPEMIAQEMKISISNLTLVIDLLAHALDRRPELYSGVMMGEDDIL